MANKSFVNTSPNETPDYKEVFAPERTEPARIRDLEISSSTVLGATLTRYISSSGNNEYFIPSTTTEAEIVLIGGGGAGGPLTGANSGDTAGSGGGAGGVIHEVVSLTNKPIRVDLGVSGLSATTVGGDSTFQDGTASYLYTANGGGRGGTVTTPTPTFSKGSSGGYGPISSSATQNTGGSGGGAGSPAIKNGPHSESPSIATMIAAANTAGLVPGTGQFGNFGFPGPFSATQAWSPPGLGLTLLGRQVAGGGPSGANNSNERYQAAYGSLAQVATSSVTPGGTTGMTYGAGGNGGHTTTTSAAAGGSGGSGTLIMRYLYQKPAGINKAYTWWPANVSTTIYNPTTNTNYTINDIAYGNGTFVAVGGATISVILTSTNGGYSWTEQSAGLNTSNNGIRVSFQDGLFSAIFASTGMRTSTDGVTWTTLSATGGANGGTGLYGTKFHTTATSGYYRDTGNWTAWAAMGGNDCVFAEGIGYVTVGSSGQTKFSATAGGSVTTVTTGSANLNSVDYVKSLGLFIAVGGSNTILTSPNGTTWTSRTSGITGVNINLQAIGWSDDGVVVVAGGSGYMLGSTDGIAWTNRISELGLISSATEGRVCRSIGPAPSIGAKTINGVAFGGGRWVAGGQNGSLVYSIG